MSFKDMETHVFFILWVWLIVYTLCNTECRCCSTDILFYVCFHSFLLANDDDEDVMRRNGAHLLGLSVVFVFLKKKKQGCSFVRLEIPSFSFLITL